MRLFFNHSFKLILPLLVLLAVAPAYAQNARLNLDSLRHLEGRAHDVVEVNIEGKLLELAKRVLVKVKDQDARKVGRAINGLEGIYVRVYNFENENEYGTTDVDQIRNQLQGPGWERLANVRSKRNNQKVDVYTMFAGDMISGVAVVVSEAKSIAVVNVIGPIDIDLLVEMSGKLNIPRIEVEKQPE